MISKESKELRYKTKNLIDAVLLQQIEDHIREAKVPRISQIAGFDEQYENERLNRAGQYFEAGGKFEALQEEANLQAMSPYARQQELLIRQKMRE